MSYIFLGVILHKLPLNNEKPNLRPGLLHALKLLLFFALRGSNCRSQPECQVMSFAHFRCISHLPGVGTDKKGTRSVRIRDGNDLR